MTSLKAVCFFHYYFRTFVGANIYVANKSQTLKRYRQPLLTPLCGIYPKLGACKDINPAWMMPS